MIPHLEFNIVNVTALICRHAHRQYVNIYIKPILTCCNITLHSREKKKFLVSQSHDFHGVVGHCGPS